MATNKFTPREVPLMKRSMKNTSGGDMAKGVAVKLGANGSDEIALAAAVSDVAVGLASHVIVDTEQGDVIMHGVGVGLAGGSITAGALLTMTTGGKLVAASPAAGVNNQLIGVALRDASTDELFEVLLTPGAIMQGA